MAINHKLFWLLIAGNAIARQVPETSNTQVNHPVYATAADVKLKPIAGYTMYTNVSGNSAASGMLTPQNTQLFVKASTAAFCAPGDPKCKAVPSVLYWNNQFGQYITLNTTDPEYAPGYQQFWLDFTGGVRYLVPPEFFSTNDEPFYGYTVRNNSKTTGIPTLHYIGDNINAPAPFFLCDRSTPGFEPPEYDIVYQLYVGLWGFHHHLNTSKCFETTVYLKPSKFGAYLFG